MRKLFLVVLFLLLAVTARADELKLQLPNLNGDVVYDFRESELGVGTGVDLVAFPDEITSIRGEWVVFYEDSSDAKNKAGLGVNVNVPALARKLGATWIPETINASVGVLGLCDFVDKPELSAGLYLTVLKISL